MPYKDPKKQKEYHKMLSHKHYLKYKEIYKKRDRMRRQKLRDFVNQYKQVPCKDCNQSFPWYVMDLDHRQGEKKIINIARMVTRAYPIDRIKVEIEKCDAVCANCHRIRTHARYKII